MQNFAPLIIIGMHRSGTTMLAKMLREFGFFFGNDIEGNNESWFFIRHNEWLLRQSGGWWDAPESAQLLMNNQTIRKMAVDYLRCRLKSMDVFKYLGLKKYFHGERPLGVMSGPWGWKDPRNTFTLPIWLDLFPQAKVIHVYRNGVDVAASLRVRDRRGVQRGIKKHSLRMKLGAYYLLKKENGFVNSIRCLDLAGGFSLWCSYIAKAQEVISKYPAQSMTICYEDFLNQPEHILSEIVRFCEIHTSPESIRENALKVDASRAHAFQGDDELLQFYREIKNTPLMQQLGYHKIL